MTNYYTEEEEYHNLPTTSISYNKGSININECSLQTIWTSTANTNNNNIPNVMPVSDSSNSTLTFNNTATSMDESGTEDGEEERNLIDSSQCVNLDNGDLVSSASESSLLDTTKLTTNKNTTNNTNNNNKVVVRQRFAEQKLSDSTITLRLSDVSSKTPPIFARGDINSMDLRGSFTRDDTPRRGTLFHGSSSKEEVPKEEETNVETSKSSTVKQYFEDSNNTVFNTPLDNTTTGEEEESPSFDNSIYRRQSTGVTSSNYDTYTNYDPVESVVGGYSTLDISRRSSTYNGGNGLDYSKRSGSCGLFSIYDDVDNNGEEEKRPVTINVSSSSRKNKAAASVQSGHTELLKQHALVDWAEYPTSPVGTATDSKEDDLNNDTSEEEEDFEDDDVSEEHYRSLDRRCSIDNTKSEEKEEEDKESNNQLVVRDGVLDPEEASFAEQERLTEYDETKNAVIVPDSTPTVPTTKQPSSKGIVQQQSQSPSGTTTVKHTNDTKPIDTSKQYNGFQHTFITIKEEHRFLMLYTFLKRNVNAKIIIFFSTTKSTQYYCKLLQRLKFTNVNCVHNGMGRDRFMNALVEFSKSSSVSAGEGDSEGGGNNKGSILCIPDFQASDISIPPSTTWLVQFEPPANPTEYIYRVGRISSETTTASNSSSHRRTRSNSTGGGSSNNHPQNPSRALLFLTPNEYGFLKYYKAANIKIYEYEISKIAKIQKQIVKLVHDDNKLHKLGVEAYHAYLGSYASHDYKDIYNTNDDAKEDQHEKLIAKCFGFESIPGKIIPSKKRVVSNRKEGNKRNDKLRGSLVKKQDSKDKLRGSLLKKKDSKDKVVLQDDEEEATHQDRKKILDEKKATPQNKKKKVPQDNSPRASRSREQNRWKPVKHEQQASWMSGKTKSWKASHVHADKMKIQGKKNLDEYKPKIVKLPKAA